MSPTTDGISPERPSATLLNDLAQEREGPCLTMVMRREFAGDASDAIRVKSALRSAEDALRAEGVEAARAQSMLGALARLADDRAIWAPGDGGLCVFAGEGVLRIVEIPECRNEMVEAAPSFFIEPVLRAVQNETSFYVLALSLGNVRLLRCDTRSCERVEIEGLPGSLPEGPARFKEYEKTLQFHTADRPAGSRTHESHGHGVGKDDEDVDRREFFRAVGNALRNADLARPIVVACDRQHRTVFRDHAGLEDILPTGPDGNTQHLSDQQLLEVARKHAQSHLGADAERDVQAVHAAAREGRVAPTVDACINSAREGRVELLLVQDGARLWGRPEQGAVVRHEHREPGDCELANEAAILTLRNGGRARLVDDMDACGFERMAATVGLLRW